ncbi:MAG: DUF1987 domain-containing protein [Ignavibacteriaceae bacterium]
MENFKIEKTKSTPSVILNYITGECEIRGSSYPENAREYYEPVFKWLNDFMLQITSEISFTFNLDYLNSSSIKIVSDLVEVLNNYGKAGIKVSINWYYSEDDDDIKELGEEFRDEVECLFNLIRNN